MRMTELNQAQKDAVERIYRRSRREENPQKFFREAVRSAPKFEGAVWNNEEYFPLQLDAANAYRVRNK